MTKAIASPACLAFSKRLAFAFLSFLLYFSRRLAGEAETLGPRSCLLAKKSGGSLLPSETLASDLSGALARMHEALAGPGTQLGHL